MYFVCISGDFPRAWALLLEFIEAAALCPNAEVSLAALKSFQEILQINKDSNNGRGDEWKLLFTPKKPDSELNPPSEERIIRNEDEERESSTDGVDTGSATITTKDSGIDDMALWTNAWKVWLSIGTQATVPPENVNHNLIYIPSQPFLSALIQIFPALYEHIKMRFVASDLQKLSTVLQRALTVPVHGDSTPFIMPIGEVELTSLQEAILQAIEVLIKVIIKHFILRKLLVYVIMKF